MDGLWLYEALASFQQAAKNSYCKLYIAQRQRYLQFLIWISHNCNFVPKKKNVQNFRIL